MCGRFAVIQTQDDLVSLFDIDEIGPDIPEPSYNIAPTERIAVVVESAKEGAEGRRLEGARWGLVPSFAKDVSIGVRAINARVETVDSNRMFATAFRKRRAIIPAAGYFEWQKLEGGKQPYFLHPDDDSPLALAGLYEWWRDPATGTWLLSATIITRPATGELEGIHDRMPLFLDDALWYDWLDPLSEGSTELLEAALAGGEAIAQSFELRPVGAAVGPTRAKVDDPSLLERVTT